MRPPDPLRTHSGGCTRRLAVLTPPGIDRVARASRPSDADRLATPTSRAPVRVGALVAVRIELDHVAERVLAIARAVGLAGEHLPDPARADASPGGGDPLGQLLDVGRQQADVE